MKTGVLLLLAGLGWSTPAPDRSADVRSETLDVGVLGFVTPAAREETGDITPQVLLHNYGSTRTDLVVTVTVHTPDSLPYASTMSISCGLPPGQDSMVQLETWSALPGSYTTRCSVWQAGDANPVNDTISLAFLVTPPDRTGWWAAPNVPTGTGKRVKDGGALACMAQASSSKPQARRPESDPLEACGLKLDAGFVYAFKGANTCEFFGYDLAEDTWCMLTAIPEMGSSGKRKRVKKGAALTGIGNRVYALKGNSTLEFWEHATESGAWTQRADVPAGTKTLKEGTGLVGLTLGDTDYVYLLKGSNTFEFYRYNATRNAWETRASAPGGRSNRAFRTGSALCSDGQGRLYALKGTQNEFFAYAVDSDRWETRASLPLLGRLGKKKKAKDGAGIAFCETRNGGRLFALKGGNTREFWNYAADSDVWTQLDDVPPGRGKQVKGGGALVAAESSLFALKGNNTLEFYCYTPGSETAEVSSTRPRIGLQASAMSSGQVSYYLPVAGRVRLGIHDITGRLLHSRSLGPQAAGVNRIDIAAFSDRLPRGIYLLRIETAGAPLTCKLVKVRP